MNSTVSNTLVNQVHCPSCAHIFRPEVICFIAEHDKLQGDRIAGPLEGLRFRSSRFNIDGNAVDMEGRVCTRVACPSCHIEIPRALLENPTCFISIVGAPGSGKSCLLGAASWSLRKLAGQYGCSWVDVEPRLNALLHGYESGLFGAGGAMRTPLKTEVAGGDWYHQIKVGTKLEMLPKPMYFRVARTGGVSSIIVMYDNAGEHFLPVAENAEPPHTRHLGQAQALLFVFDPTMSHASDKAQRQELILIEAVSRIRRLAGVSQSAKLPIPIIIVLSKADLWAQEIRSYITQPPIAPGTIVDLDRQKIEEVSTLSHAYMSEKFPEFVQSVAAFSDRVQWVPCCAMKSSGKASTGQVENQPRANWSEVPFLLAFDQIARSQRRK
ncbi:MAG: hypothetical protein EXS15_08250 [Phycisphaerales bacterium]|nr:hypothetical protein [Phycisphaerales bacterium]